MPEPSEPEFIPITDDTGINASVRADIIQGLDEWFKSDSNGFLLRSDLHTDGDISNGRVSAVVWRYVASPRPEVWGVAARGPIHVDGATFVDNGGSDDPSRQQFSRYIDWHGVFSQLGVAAAGRVVDDTLES